MFSRLCLFWHVLPSMLFLRYILCLFVCLSVYLYSLNVKTAEPIEPKLFVGPQIFPEKVYGLSKVQEFASNKIRFSLNFENPQNLFYKIRGPFCVFTLQCIQSEKCSKLK